MEKPKNRVRIYHFYNIEAQAYGATFAMCDKCLESYQVPSFCRMELIGDAKTEECAKCK